ncbi:MAG: hypothetical protein QHJ82_12520, partial [Verrucomicrobiota bacterium]|nr:hypothetical protein [Verrucomicrobiota bacterium]
FPATESQGIFPSPAWLKVRGVQEPGRCPSGDFGSGYAGLGNMRAKDQTLLLAIACARVDSERRITDQLFGPVAAANMA